MPTTTTVDLDHGSYSGAGIDGTIGERFTPLYDCTLTRFRIRTNSTVQTNFRVYRVSDGARLLAVDDLFTTQVGWNEFDVPDLALAAGQTYVLATSLAQALTVSFGAGRVAHQHGIIWVENNYFTAGGNNHPTTPGNGSLECNFGAVFVYNRPPTTPGTPTAPAAQQVVNTAATLSWGAATDPDGDPVQYWVDLTVDNGATWTRILNNITGTSAVYDFTNVPATSAARIRVLAGQNPDIGAYSSLVEGPTFTIQHGSYTPMIML